MNKHPDKILLEAYASGSIDAVSGLVVATHLETCSKCRACVNEIEAEQASVAVSDIASEYDADFDIMFNDIITAEPTPESVVIKDIAKVEVAAQRQRFVENGGVRVRLFPLAPRGRHDTRLTKPDSLCG